MLNLAVIMGRLTRDPELRQTPNGVSTTTISVAVDRDYKKDGQDKETDFLDVVAWRSTAEFICNNFSKGQMIALYGRLQKRSYEDANGNKRTVTEVIADSVYFCGPKMQQNSEAPAGNSFERLYFRLRSAAASPAISTARSSKYAADYATAKHPTGSDYPPIHTSTAAASRCSRCRHDV